ncbi:hypothetical protein PPUN110474_10090 [Pseudomonas putida]|nr:hypothetical protein PPUN110474_10090 [Pseudomonas putida]
MFKSLEKGYKDIKGTASELCDNRAYDQLVEITGPEGGRQAIIPKLAERDLTPEQWDEYRNVRRILHQSTLCVNETLDEVRGLVSA